MLIVLVGVTTVLLLIMGSVSTYLLARRDDAQLATAGNRLRTLAAELAANPQAAQELKVTDFAVVEIPVRGQIAVDPLTHGPVTSQLVAAATRQLNSAGFAPVLALAARGEMLRARILLASRGCGQFPSLGCKGFEIAPGLAAASHWVPAIRNSSGTGIAAGHGAILLVAQPVGSGADEIAGYIIAELITGAALIALVALAGAWLVGRGLDPLDDMTRTANDITSRGDLTARMPDANDQTEVGRLGTSINTMLDRIQQAFTSRLRSEQKVREFAADASHELRTPLTTIRGYAELYRQGALGPDQLPDAMRRIEQESERMSMLVAELLELARLDRTSSLDLTETDLAGVVRDAVADAIAVEPQRPGRAEAPPRLVAVVDERRIRQVLANLLGNVRAHTPATTPVAVRLGAIGGGVLIEVADAGPGMSEQDAARAFDRFHRSADRQGSSSAGAVHKTDQGGNGADGASARGGSGRFERTSGSGLGLSIVQAIATAHGGRATLESIQGQGTKVRVWLRVRIVP